MKDIDFDELDKAVNSLMTNVPKTDEPSKDTGQKTLDLTPVSDKPAATPVLSRPVSPASAGQQSNAAPLAAAQPRSESASAKSSMARPPASRRAGRFMDVVHPSSDMKGQASSDTPARVSRQGVSIEPRPEAAKPQDRTPAVEPAAPMTETPIQGIAAPPPVVSEKTPPVSDWPDPLEMSGFKHEPEDTADTKTTPETSAPAGAKELDVEPEVKKEQAESEQTPLTSPFLPGAKVEKRPLGSGMPAVEEPDRVPLAGSETAKTINDPEAQLPATPKPTDEPLPEELQGDLMAVEADTHMGVPKTDETHPLKEALDLSEPEEKLLPEKTESAPKKDSPASAPPEVPAGPTSIPQQYREEPSTGDKKSGAIYDTDSYHKPLAHPAKKKSGWLWIVWIIIILLIGAGGGAALYFFGLM